MKKIIMAVIGITLFVAGYQHTRRQAEYLTTQATAQQPDRLNRQSVPSSHQHLFAFRLTKPS